jgi:hypothetical protein
MAALKAVGEGSNITDYATDQGMAGDPNFDKYMAHRSYYRMHRVQGGWFSYHGQQGRDWALKQRQLDEQRRAADEAAKAKQPDNTVTPEAKARVTIHPLEPMSAANRGAYRSEQDRSAHLTIDFQNLPKEVKTSVDHENFKSAKVNRGFALPQANEGQNP